MTEYLRRLATISAGVSRIATCTDGTGPTLVVLPSYGRDGLDDFDRFTDLIVAKGWRVLRPQPRGIAGSAGPLEGIYLKDLAEGVAGVIRRLCTGPVVILGHAFGSMIARVLSVEHPDLVRAAILAAASATRVAPEINETPFIAGDSTRPEEERLAALRLAFFAPGCPPSALMRQTWGLRRGRVSGAS